MTDAQPVRRMKTYTGGQGYVYQYYFVSRRPTVPGEAPGTEYVFDVTSDRKSTFSVSVFLLDEGTRAFTSAHGRTLSDAEQYGAAKMRLFEAFDAIPDMKSEGRRLILNTDSLERVLGTLGVE